MNLKVRELCFISLLGALEFVVFTSFSQILYLECITFVIVVVALNFSRKTAVFSSLIFTIVNLGVMGVTPWSLLYILIYPTYSLILSILSRIINKYAWSVIAVCGMLSFLTGQLMELPYLLVSKNVTIAYLIVGLKTSLLQGIVSALFCALCYQSIVKVLKRLEK